jgi:hypothetical protein
MQRGHKLQKVQRFLMESFVGDKQRGISSMEQTAANDDKI